MHLNPPTVPHACSGQGGGGQRGVTDDPYTWVMDRRTAVLVALALVAGAQARKAVPGLHPVGQPRVTATATAAQLRAAQPTFGLMQTVQALRDLIRLGDVTLDDGTRSRLAQTLGPLESASTLNPAHALRVTEMLRAELDATALAAVDRLLAAREQRAQAVLSRARLATPDGPVGVPLATLSLTVPGGRAAVLRVLSAPHVNPFAVGQSAHLLLRDLLELLGVPEV